MTLRRFFTYLEVLRADGRMHGPFFHDCRMVGVALECSNALATQRLFSLSWSQLLLSFLCIWLNKKLNGFCASQSGPQGMPQYIHDGYRKVLRQY